MFINKKEETEERISLTTCPYILKDKRPNPDFTRLEKALRCEVPDRVPLAELGVDKEVKCAFLGREISNVKDEVEFWVGAGYDYVNFWVTEIMPRAIQVQNSHRTTYQEGEQERAWVSEGKGVITSWEDFEKYKWPLPEDAFLRFIEEGGKYLPEGMKIICSTNGVFEVVSQAMGLETFLLALMDNVSLIEAMLEKIGDFQLQILRKAVQLPKVGAIWIGDDLAYNTSTIISPVHLRKYVFPWYKKFCQVAQDYSLPIIFHTDGDVRAVLEDIIECGFNALHPIEPKAMDIKELKERYKGRICLIGNIDLNYTLPRGTPEEVEEEVKEKLRDLAPGGGYCLGSANSVPSYVPLPNFVAMNQTCLKYGKYPINI